MCSWSHSSFEAASSSTVISRLVSGSEDPAVIPSNDPQHKSWVSLKQKPMVALCTSYIQVHDEIAGGDGCSDWPWQLPHLSHVWPQLFMGCVVELFNLPLLCGVLESFTYTQLIQQISFSFQKAFTWLKNVLLKQLSQSIFRLISSQRNITALR